MNLKGKLSTNLSLSGNASIPTKVNTGGASTWNEITGKPFSTVDTEGGLTIYDNTLGIDTLDTIATINYVDSQIDGVTTTLEDYALKSEIPTVPSDVSAFNNDAGYITAESLTPYVESSDLASVAFSGDYDDLLNKPTIPTVPTDVSAFNNDAGYLTSSDVSAVALSGEYSDLLNSPVFTNTLQSGTTIADIEAYGQTLTLYAPTPTAVGITNTLSTGTAIGDLEIDGVTTTLYAPAGSSVSIDNKSIVKNQNDELQEAVPVYSESVEIPLPATGLVITDFVPNGTTDADFYVDTNANTLTLLPEANNYDNYEFYLVGSAATLKCGWKASTSSTMDGAKILESTNTAAYPINRTFQFYYSYTTSHFPSGSGGYKFHIYNLGGNYSVWDTLILYPTATGIANGDTLESQCETLGLNWTGTQTQTIYHKLPMDYVDLNIITDETLYNGFYPMLYNDANGNIRAKRLGAGSNMSLSTTNLADGTQGYQIGCTLKESPVGGYVSGEGGSSSLYLSNYEDISGGNPFKRRYYTSQSNWNSFFNNAGNNKDLTFSLRYCTSSSYYNSGPKITGVIHLGASNTDQPVIEGFEEIIDSYYIDTTNTTKYFCIELKDGYNIGFSQSITMLRPVNYYPIKQNISSFFLPLDNSTIIRDLTSGNIKTAIPAPPTTDGTYTLQVTVSNGTITYSWI